MQKFTKTQQKIKKHINKIYLPLLKEKDVFEHEEREGWHLLSIVNNKDWIKSKIRATIESSEKAK